MSGAVFMGRSAAAGAGAAATGAAACTVFFAHPTDANEIVQVRSAIAIRASFSRLGIYRFSATMGRSSVAGSSGGRVHESRQRQFHAERRAAPGFGFEFYLAIVQLYKPKRVRQPDAAASRARREEELKDLLLIAGRDSSAGVFHD